MTKKKKKFVLVKDAREWSANVQILQADLIMAMSDPGNAHWVTLSVVGFFGLSGLILWFLGWKNFSYIMWFLSGLQLYGFLRGQYKKWKVKK